MTLSNITALAALRLSTFGIATQYNRSKAFAQLVIDKDYPKQIVERLSGRGLGYLTSEFLLDRSGGDASLLYKSNVEPNPQVTPYWGRPEQDIIIDRAAALNAASRTVVGDGASVRLSQSGNIHYELPRHFGFGTLDIPIAIIGVGAAGIIVAAGLRDLGFTNVNVFERRREVAGIWSERSVFEGSRNNPRTLEIHGRVLHAAPGDGYDVRNVLRSLSFSRQTTNYPTVSRVIPGNLDHAIECADGTTRRFPIVFNACGMGQPRPISHPMKMIGPSQHVRAIRWQYPQLTTTRNRRFVLIGLGNSTAEMLQVIQRDRTADYRILTHYPRDSVFNPGDSVSHNHVNYRVFRDLSKPNLTSFQGDLRTSRNAYYRALLDGKIITDVKQWDVKTEHDHRVLGVRRRGERRVKDAFPFDDIYVLNGYQHTAASLTAMGLQYTDDLYPRYDYDGEFQTGNYFSDRVYKGYFGFGSVLNASHNKNSIVLPGMIFRAPQLFFGFLMRVLEYQYRRKPKS